MLESTYNLLDQCQADGDDIAVGAGVGKHWLAKFRQRKMGDPGVNKVQRLHDYLERISREEHAA